MAETDTDAADQFDASVDAAKLNETLPGLWKRYRKLPRNVFAISLVSLLNDASSEIIYPLLPIFISSSLGASARAIGVIEGTAESISSLLKLFAGYLSDRWRQRKLLVVCVFPIVVSDPVAIKIEICDVVAAWFVAEGLVKDRRKAHGNFAIAGCGLG